MSGKSRRRTVLIGSQRHAHKTNFGPKLASCDPIWSFIGRYRRSGRIASCYLCQLDHLTNQREARPFRFIESGKVGNGTGTTPCNAITPERHSLAQRKTYSRLRRDG